MHRVNVDELALEPVCDYVIQRSANAHSKSPIRTIGLAIVSCAIGNSAERVQSTQCLRGRDGARSEPYAADRRRSDRVDRRCNYSQNAGARRREREHTRLDER